MKATKPTPSNYTRFLNTFSGKQLTKEMLAQEGVFVVRGEDPNCDFGGAHYQPTLGYFHGKLDEVVRFAVELPGFWTWGAGGDFTKVEIVELDEAKKKAARIGELLAAKEKIESELAKLA